MHSKVKASVHQLCPRDETQRLAALRRYHILDTPPDGTFDRITTIAARLFAVPISIISLVDENRIWFKSHHGLDVEEIDRGPGLCASAILHQDAWVLTDARHDVRAMTNPLVAGEFGLRFYVGIPLQTHDGYNLGTLCVIDREPRPVTEGQIADLRDLASLVMDQIELRLSARRAVAEISQLASEKDAALERAELMAKEIDHRVMNSLQLVSALLRLQSRAFKGSDAAEQIAIAASRVATISRVHQHIYTADRVGCTGTTEYLKRLCADLVDVIGSENVAKLDFHGSDIRLPTPLIAPIGLIVNELVTNAAKHGATHIAVELEACTTGGYALSVSDDGEGLPADFDLASGSGLGMKIISAQVQTLRGTIAAGEAANGQGAKFTIRFPVPGLDAQQN